MEKLLICGDSFAADWTQKYSGLGWPNLLEQNFHVTNLAQAGCSEYKIWLQIESMLNRLGEFKYVLVSHTSPYRIYVKTHPVHFNDVLHCSSDLIYTDIVDKKNDGHDVDVIVEWFEKYFDLDHARFTHNLICEKIDRVLKQHNISTLHITNLEWSGLYQFDKMYQFNHLFKKHRGLMNHYSEAGNLEIFNTIKNQLLKLT